jgi:ribosomal protein L11
MPDLNREDLQCGVATNAPPLQPKLDSTKLNVLAMNEKMHMVLLYFCGFVE